MTITNRDELIDALEDEFNDIADVSPIEILRLAFDWLSEQGFALVSLEPTVHTMLEALTVHDPLIMTTPKTIFEARLKAANEAGDLLKRRE